MLKADQQEIDRALLRNDVDLRRIERRLSWLSLFAALCF
jgi:hypothetical protein